MYIFTTLRFDPSLLDSSENTASSRGRPSSIYLLCYHHRRLSEAVAAASSAGYAGEWLAEVPDADALERVVLRGLGSGDLIGDLKGIGVQRIKVCLYQDGKLTVDCPGTPLGQPLLFPTVFEQAPTPTWEAVIDSHPTNPRMCTSFKTSDREDYDRARASAGVHSTQEVLLWNTLGQIMDASITTPYFFRGNQWVTPPATSGGQYGTSRRWALDQKLCIGQVVPVSSLSDGEMIWLSNALRGFFPATLRLRTSWIA